MNREEWFNHKWHYLRRFAKLVLLGILLIVLGAYTHPAFALIGILLFFPLIFWLVLIPLYHWKDRYIGEKSTLWGVLIFIGPHPWGSIIYWIRHILPDKWKMDRYSSLD